jgi:LacI family transcriptional regulator
MDTGEKVAGIKDIAAALKISIGTVDRALHGRPGVSKSTKASVLDMAERLGYKPNLAAQSLKLNRRISIAVVLPKQIAHFFDPLRQGIRAAAAAAVSVHPAIDFFEYPRLGVGDAEALTILLEKHYDGIILVPGGSPKSNPLIRKLSRAGSAIMCVGSDAPNTDRIGSVAVHASVSGAIAAELLSYKLTTRASVAIFSGELAMLDHAEKLRGFAATLAVQAPHLTLLPALESHERPKEAYRQTLALMKRKDRPAGLYLSTANSLPVLKALEEMGLLGKGQIVTTDLFQELLPMIEDGKILASMYQRPYTQGKVAFENLLAHLLKEGNLQSTVRLAPHVIFRSNLSLFSNQILESEDDLSQ